ncbi:MAG TPA: phosphodiester glycosidase family protein, partial [Verrucomicrobiae bacterium]|nr:phosphodiester glycosidase family protein [Verrucomicrobiae bacterium]
MRRIGLSAGLLLAVLLWVLPAAATITVSGWSPLYRGIDFATGTADASETRIQKVFTMRVDLTDPTIEFYSTPPTPNGTNETIGQVTTDFVKSHGLAIGINANFFAPVVQQANYPRSLSGLAISQGVLVSSFQSSYPSVLITLGNQVSFATSNPSNLGNVWTSVSGSDMVLLNGVPQLQSCTTDFCLENPRTAVGLSHDGHYFYLMVIDGRQPSWSMGATLYETGQWLARFGAWTGLNLDGGGSTAMAKGQNGTATLINKPSGGTQRYVGNNLGVFAEPLGGAVWNGGGADNYWENPANWNGYNLSPGVGADLHFAGTTRLSCSNNFTAGSNFGDITFDPGAGVFN